MKIKFEINGEPTGKGRPRFVRTVTGGRAVTPAKTSMYENIVRLEYERQIKGFKFDSDDMLKMNIEAFFSIPKSKSKKIKCKMLANEIRPTKKPDMDNIIKIIADALNNFAYYDDKQIVECNIKKYYSENPRVAVEIENIERN